MTTFTQQHSTLIEIKKGLQLIFPDLDLSTLPSPVIEIFTSSLITEMLTRYDDEFKKRLMVFDKLMELVKIIFAEANYETANFNDFKIDLINEKLYIEHHEKTR